MTFEEFSRIIREGLQEQLEDGISISLDQIKENNGTVRTVLTLSRGKGGLCPRFDMRSLYEQYQEMGEDWEAMDQVLRSLREAGSGIGRERAKREEIGDILDYEQWKESIVFRLVNTEKNREFLKTVPHTDILDLSVVFYALLEVSREGAAMMTICENHLRQWDIGRDVLWKAAEENVRRILPAELFTMRHALNEIVGSAEAGSDEGNLLDGGDGERDRMYVLTNRMRSYGAACIAYPYIPGMIGETLGSDYYILPSSVHEVMIVPACGGLDGEELEEMVREINATQVAEEEVLSDHIYYYERRTGCLRMFDPAGKRKEGVR